MLLAFFLGESAPVILPLTRSVDLNESWKYREKVSHHRSPHDSFNPTHLQELYLSSIRISLHILLTPQLL